MIAWKRMVTFTAAGALLGLILRSPAQGAIIGGFFGLTVPAARCPRLYKGHVIAQNPEGQVRIPEYRRTFPSWSEAKAWLDKHVAESEEPAPSADETAAAKALAGFGFDAGQVPNKVRSAWDARLVAGAAWIMDGRAGGSYASPWQVAMSDRLPWNSLEQVPKILAAVKAALRTERARNYVTAVAREYYVSVEQGKLDQVRRPSLPVAKATPPPNVTERKKGEIAAELLTSVARGYNERRAPAAPKAAKRKAGAAVTAPAPDLPSAEATPEPANDSSGALPSWVLPVGGVSLALLTVGLAAHFGRQREAA